MHQLAQWIEAHMLPCFYEKCLGVQCPGCGMQRAFVELLKGNFLQSLKLYPALIPVMVMMLFLMLHLIFRFRKGGIILQWLFISNAGIIFFSYLYKLTVINH